MDRRLRRLQFPRPRASWRRRHFEHLALQTVDQVHAHLGRFRADGAHRGWLHGPHGAADAAHPTRAGLRIGKPLPERAPDEPFDEAVEWDRDGQYFHYLTRWMHALDGLARTGAAAHFGLWARELADVAHRAFTYALPDGGKRMHWKMSIDLSRPLVASMGQHDPLDGLVGTLSLRAGSGRSEPKLDAAIGDYSAMVDSSALATADPLGLGGLLMDAFRLEPLLREDTHADGALLDRILGSAAAGLAHCRLAPGAAAGTRLGFRELGLAIGLAAVERMQPGMNGGEPRGGPRTRDWLRELARYTPLRGAINAFWLDPANREAPTWTGHRDINEVMLATSLMPDGWLM